MNNPGYIWHSMTEPDSRSGARRFDYERIGYVDGVEVHRETRPVWTYSRSAFVDLLSRWNRLSSRPSAEGKRHYSYKESTQ